MLDERVKYPLMKMAQLCLSIKGSQSGKANLQMCAHARVLVVDDEPLLRLFNVDMLSDAGFEVLEASNADEALRLLEQTDDIRVVFTDVEMPGQIDGFGLALRIEAQWPEIGVVVTSGRRLPEKAFDAPARCFVAKPYQPAQVVRLIDAFVSVSAA